MKDKSEHIDSQLPFVVQCNDGAEGMLSELEDNSVKLIYGSPPYPNADRNYGNWHSDEYIEKITPFIDAAVQKLRPDGFLVINIKANRERQKTGINSRRSLVVEKLALMLEEHWHMYCVDIEIWIKDNPVPTGLRVACQDAYEQILWFSKSGRWKINIDAIRRPYNEESLRSYAQNTYKPRGNGLSYVRKEKRITPNLKGALPLNIIRGSVSGKQGIHQAVQPGYIPQKYIKACTKPNDIVVDPWVGSGTTGVEAVALYRRFYGFDINKDYVAIANEAINESYEAAMIKSRLTQSRIQLQQYFLSKLGDALVEHSDVEERPLLVTIEIPFKITLTVYLFPSTNPPGGRALNEYKFNLSVPSQKRGERGSFDRTFGDPLLVSYIADYDVFAIYDAEKHQSFSLNANVQIRQEAALEAMLKNVATYKRSSGEIVVTAYAPYLVDGIKKWFDLHINL